MEKDMDSILKSFFQKLQETDEQSMVVNEGGVVKKIFGDELNPLLFDLLEIRSKHTCDISTGPIEIVDSKWMWWETDLGNSDNLLEQAIYSGEPVQLFFALGGMIAIGVDGSGNPILVQANGRNVCLSGHDTMFQLVKVADDLESFIKMNNCYDLVSRGDNTEAKLIAEKIRPHTIDVSEYPHNIYSDYDGTIEKLTGKESPAPGDAVDKLWRKMSWLFSPLYFSSGIDDFCPSELPEMKAATPVDLLDLWISAVHKSRTETAEFISSFGSDNTGAIQQTLRFLKELNDESKVLPGNLSLQQMRDKIEETS
jgi:hypothetical protein